MDSLPLALSCVLGLLVGGIGGAFGFAILGQIRSGRIKVPPIIALGPIKIDISGLGPQSPGQSTSESDWSSAAPLVNNGGAATGGCLSVVSAGLVLVGFILPWFTFSSTLFSISGNMSGFGALIQIVLSVILSLLASLGLAGLGILGYQQGAGGAAAIGVVGLLLTLVLLALTMFLALVPIMGFRIGRMGLRLIQSLKTTTPEQRRRLGRSLTVAAVLGSVPLLCYTANVSSTVNIGFSVANLGVGLWTTLAGFGLAFIAGLMISTSVAVADQLKQSPPTDDKSAS